MLQILSSFQHDALTHGDQTPLEIAMAYAIIIDQELKRCVCLFVCVYGVYMLK